MNDGALSITLSSLILLMACASDTAIPDSDAAPDRADDFADAGEEDATQPADSPDGGAGVDAGAEAGAMPPGRDGGDPSDPRTRPRRQTAV